jgi:hypothetical protein
MDTHGFPEGDFGLIIYGSLIYKPALKELFSNPETRVSRVRLDGFARVFDMAADRRRTAANRNAVLNLHRDAESWCNGLLVESVTPREYGIYARRETEYRTTLVKRDDISFYESNADAVPKEVIVSYDGPSQTDIYPIPSYVKRCLKGATQWGEEFYDEFVSTTSLATEESLAAYLD